MAPGWVACAAASRTTTKAVNKRKDAIINTHRRAAIVASSFVTNPNC
jgi:hypothetical protein